jgi:hypothetical protein
MKSEVDNRSTLANPRQVCLWTGKAEKTEDNRFSKVRANGAHIAFVSRGTTFDQIDCRVAGQTKGFVENSTSFPGGFKVTSQDYYSTHSG